MERSRCAALRSHARAEQTGVEIWTRAGRLWQMQRCVTRVWGRTGGIWGGGGGAVAFNADAKVKNMTFRSCQAMLNEEK